MMGYTEQDIAQFGNTLTRAIDDAKSQSDEQQWKELIMVRDFFDGLLTEGRV